MLRVHPDGSRLLAGTDTGRILVLDASDGRLLVALGGHTSAVYGLCFVEGTETLLSTSRSGRLRVWKMD